jgi:predicted ATPase/class 3 adenylate cyclase
MGSLPTGTVTFLFTDIEGSTKLAQEHPNRWESLRERHHSILRGAIEAKHGFIFQIIGDAFCVAFHTARDGLCAAIEAQRELQTENWGDAAIKVRMGLHTGTAEFHGTDYRGYINLARVQRVMSMGYGGQILLSNTASELVRGELPDDVTLRDMGEHWLKGLLNPEHLWQVNVSDLAQDFPPLRSLNKIPHNLPSQLTSFIGREEEISEIREALGSHRLVTLTGSGGTGKTRLSLEVAAAEIERFPDGVWFIELAPLVDPDLIPITILSVMHLSEQAGKTALKVLEEQINSKKMLFILDNCEHLIQGSAAISHTLLITLPNLQILASSREAMGIQGELSWHVPSLRMPDSKGIIQAEQLSQYEAVRLFIDRATLIQPYFVITNENAPAVAQICDQLDGIPLAIELAAARLKMLSPEQIAARLDDRFRLLTSGSRTVLPRQQTLRAMIDWSYALLDKKEATLFRRLAVFSSGCTLEAVEHICVDTDYSTLLQEEILDLLAHLVDKSLVNTKENGNTIRYSMLESTRQYAGEKLRAAGEASELSHRHATYYANLEPKTDDELDNIRSVFRWCLEREESAPVLKLSRDFYFWEKHVTEGLQLITRVLAMKGAQGQTRDRGLVLYSAAALSVFYRDYQTARAYINELFTLSHATNNALMIWSQKFIDGVCTLGEGDYERAYIIFLAAKNEKEGSTEDADRFRYALCTLAIASCTLMFQKIKDARAYAEEAQKILSELSESIYLIDGDMILGYISLETGDLGRARQYFLHGIETAISNSVQQKLGVIFAGLGSIALYEGKLYDAANLFGVSDMMITTTGYHTRFFPEEICQRYLLELKSQSNPDAFQVAWKEGNSMTLEQAIAFALEKNFD